MKNFSLNIKPLFNPLKIDYIQIKATKANNLKLWQSKFGGLPYLPAKIKYPYNVKNQPLYLLAQINFDKMPKLNRYSEQVLLQF
jgi:uncharacterized protein YwqG